MALNEEILDNHINSKVKVFVDMRGWLIKGSGFLSRNELCDYEVLWIGVIEVSVLRD
jgi:hypothetical protein